MPDPSSTDLRAARRALIRLLPRVSLPLSAAVAALVVATAVASPLATLLTGALAETLAGAARSGLDAAARRALLRTVAALAGVALVQQTLSPLSLLAMDALGRRVRTAVSARTMRGVLAPAGVVHLEDPHLADHVERASDVGPLSTRNAVRGLVSQWTSRLTGLGSLVLVARFRVWLALLLLAALAANGSVLRRLHRRLAQYTSEQASLRRRIAYLQSLVLAPPAAKEVRVFGIGDWLVDRFRAEWLETMGRIWARRRRDAPWVGAAFTPVLAVQVLAIGMASRAGVGTLVVVVQAVFSSQRLAQVGLADSQVEQGAASLPAVAALEAMVAGPRLHPAGRASPAGMPRAGIRFESVGFRYPGASRDVLDGLDLDIEAGRSLAVVGRNGAGKTTLVKLLARLHEPTAGRVTVDGVPLHTLEPVEWQRSFALLSQLPARWPVSLEDAIAFGALEHRDDRDALEAAARDAGILDIVASLPDGWRTVLNRQYTGGADLSAGQWQRVALARAASPSWSATGSAPSGWPTSSWSSRKDASPSRARTTT